jgi:hypothetical protein
VGFARSIALLLYNFYSGLIPRIQFLVESILLALALLNLELGIIDVFLVFMDEFRNLILHMEDAGAGLVCNLVNVHHEKTLLESIDCTFITYKLLVLDA